MTYGMQSNLKCSLPHKEKAGFVFKDAFCRTFQESAKYAPLLMHASPRLSSNSRNYFV